MSRIESVLANAKSLREAARKLELDEWFLSEYIEKNHLKRRMRLTVERAEQRIAALSPTWDALQLDREIERLQNMKASFLLK